MILQQITDSFTDNPKSLFLLDGIGALSSAVLLGVVLVEFETIFGMPKQALYVLALLPCVFLLYDFWCYFRGARNWNLYIKAIAIANLLYCFLSIDMVAYHFEELATLGLIYFAIELLILLLLIRIELNVALQKKKAEQ